MDEILKVEDLAFSYQEERSLLTQIGFSVTEGEFFGIIGPNGAGKTTLLRLITGYFRPQKGAVYVLKRNLKEISIRERARIFSVVPQGINTFFNFKVKEIVALGRLPYHGKNNLREDRLVIDEAMDKAHVLHLSERRFFSLSGGEKQRVLIAKSFAQNPKILLLDEFTTHLDIYHQKKITDILLREKKERGLTIIATFHDINLAGILSDRIMILKAGKIPCKGKPSDIITEDTIRNTYSVTPVIRHHPKYGVPQIFYP